MQQVRPARAQNLTSERRTTPHQKYVSGTIEIDAGTSFRFPEVVEVLQAIQLRLDAIEAHLAGPAANAWLGTTAAAAYVGMNPEAFRAAAKRGQFVVHRDGAGRWRFRRADLDAAMTAGDR